MQCPKCGYDKLDTKRTFDLCDTVKRERSCSQCNIKLITIELFEDDLEKSRAESLKQIHDAENENQRLKRRINEILQTVKAFMRLEKEERE